MKRNHRTFFTLLISALILSGISFIPRTIKAQSLLQSWSFEPQISLEFYHPNFKSPNFEGLTNVSFLNIRYPLNNKFLINVDVPFVYSKYTINYFNYDQRADPIYRQTERNFSPGNPYVGLTIYDPTTPLSVDVGLRIPLASHINGVLSVVANETSLYRYDSSIQNVFTLTLRGNYRGTFNQFFAYQLYFGGIAALNFQNSNNGELILPYGFALQYVKKLALLGGGISGIFDATMDNANFAQRNRLYLYADGGLNLNEWSPSLYFGVPIDGEARKTLHWIMGFRVTLNLNKILK